MILIRDFGELSRQAAAWRSLLERSSANEPMLSPTWLLAWWRTYGQGHQLAVGLFHNGDQLVGLVPLLRRRYWYRPGIPFRRLEFLGADVDEQDGVCSDYLNAIAERGQEARVADAFAAAVAGGKFGSWDEVDLPALAGDNPLTGLLTGAFARAGYRVDREQTTVAPHIPLPATWDHYLKALSQRDRYYVVRAQREFDQWAAGTATWHRAGSLAELEKGKRVLTALHTERWEAIGATGVFRATRFKAFHDVVMPQLLADGALELLWLTVRDQPVAALYNIVWNNKVYFYQSGRKLDVPRQVRPGIVLLSLAIRQAIEAGRREFDFLGGEAQYKGQLALATRPVIRLRVARRTLVEGTRHLADGGIWGLRAVRNATYSAGQWLRNFSQKE